MTQTEITSSKGGKRDRLSTFLPHAIQKYISPTLVTQAPNNLNISFIGFIYSVSKAKPFNLAFSF